MTQKNNSSGSDSDLLNESFWRDLQSNFPFSLLLLGEKGHTLYRSIQDKELSQVVDSLLDNNTNDIGASFKAFIKKDISEFREEIKLENDRIFEIHGFNIKSQLPEAPVIIHAITFYETSDIRRLEFLVKENERRMRSLLDASKDVFLVVSEEGIIRNQQNSSAQGIFLGEKLIGKNLSDIFQFNKNKAELDRALATSHEGSNVQVFEATYLKGKDRFYLEIRIVPGIGRDVVVLVRDKTDLHTQEEHLHMLERNASFVDIASGMSNELLNRIQSIRSCVGPLQLGDIPLALDPYIKKIEEESKQSEIILKNLFTYTGTHKEEVQVIDLKEAIQKALLFCSYGIPDGIKVKQNLPEEEVSINAPFKQTVGIIINVIMNAREAMENRGLITLSLKKKRLNLADKKHIRGSWQPGDFQELSICDNGSGMSSEMINKIFEPLFSTKTDKDSTGMGLTILNRFITKQNGGIKVESGLGKGTCFYLYLPVLFSDGVITTAVDNELVIDIQHHEDETLHYDFSPMAHGQAIELLEGNEELYHIICKDFILDYGNASTYIRDKLRENDWENARIIVHSIKGLAGLVGSPELQEKAREYEIVLKNKDKELLNTVASNFNANLEYVVLKLKKYLQTNSSSIENISPAELEEENITLKESLLKELLKLRPCLELSEYNESLEYIDRFKQFREDDHWDFLVHSIEDMIKQFHFDEALKVIEKYTLK